MACVSVGAVCSPDYLKQREGLARRTSLQCTPSTRCRMSRSAWRTAEITGNLHATGNYSYSCSRISGPRWMMVGTTPARSST